VDTKEELGKRGKKAEDAAHKFLKSLKELDSSFDFQRQLDARAAGGRFPSQTGDYLIFRPQAHGVLEVKALAHDFRLPNKNFGAEQIAKCRRREMAGGKVVVLVYHSTIQKWRAPEFCLFTAAIDASSWVLSGYPTYDTPADALVHEYPFLFERRSAA